MTAAKAGVYFFSIKEETKNLYLNFVGEQRDIEPIAVTLAKAHLETDMTDYIIMGFNRNEDPIRIKEYFNVGSLDILTKLYELFIERTKNYGK